MPNNAINPDNEKRRAGRFQVMPALDEERNSMTWATGTLAARSGVENQLEAAL